MLTHSQRRVQRTRYLPAGLDTTEIGCCGCCTAAFVRRPWTDGHLHNFVAAWAADGTARVVHRHHPGLSHPDSSCNLLPGCYFCSPEAGIRSFVAADSNTGRRQRLLDCRLAYCSHDCSHRDLGSRPDPCHTPSGCFVVSESIELPFCTQTHPNRYSLSIPKHNIFLLFLLSTYLVKSLFCVSCSMRSSRFLKKSTSI